MSCLKLLVTCNMFAPDCDLQEAAGEDSGRAQEHSAHHHQGLDQVECV